MSLSIDLIPILQDNYAFLLTTPDGLCAVVDPGDAQPILDVLNARDLTLSYILNTHHHYDHTDGNAALVAATGARIVAPASEKERISGISFPLSEGNIFQFGHFDFHTIETPGHTRGHISFYCPQAGVLFCGDTLFSMGCGRLFEGSAEDQFQSLQKIRALPDETLVYCGHEYTQSNGAFCQSVEPDNKALAQRMNQVTTLREAGTPTIPVSLATEKQTNVFLRAKNAAELGALRTKKDHA